MTPQELKELAEFGAEFLGWKLQPQNQWLIPDLINWLYYVPTKHRDELPRDFFDGDSSAPILAHLAKREMENQVCEYAHDYSVDIGHSYAMCPLDGGRYTAEHENEYIALWLAIREAVEDG